MHHFYRRKGKLYAEEVALDSLAGEHGTPLYVYSGLTFTDHYHGIDTALSGLDRMICYAVKANSNLAVLSLLAKAGSGFDIVSQGELYRVLRAGGRADCCTFAGVGKTREEIEFALKKGIYCFNVESEEELLFIDKVAARLKKKAPVALRVNPNVDASTHKKITTGTYENKFGIAYEEIPALYARAARLRHITLRGVQMHIGSQITTPAPFVMAVRKMVPLVEQLRDAHGLEFFDIGGGIGIVYEQALDSGLSKWWKASRKVPMTLEQYASGVVPMLEKLGMRILVEPGRLIAGNAGILVTEVLYVKKTGKKTFVMVDAAMNDLARPSMYDAYHEIIPLRESRGKAVPTDVVGPICESGDVFCKDRLLPPLKAGDRLAILSSGAYGFTMASNYNTRPRPAELLVQGRNVTVARKREKLSDLLRGEAAL